MSITREKFLSSFREKYPQLQDVDDNELYGSLIKKFPQYENKITKERNESVWDSMPDMIKSGYNKSIQGMTKEMTTGKKRFDLSGYQPSILEDIGSELLSNFSSIPDIATTVISGGIGGVAGKKLFGNFVFKKLTQNKVKKEVAREVAAKSIARGIGASGAQFGTYQGARDYLSQKIETGEAEPGQVVKSTLGGLALGGISAGGGGYLTARGYSTLSRIGAEIGTFGTGTPLLEGELPTPQDYLDSAGMVLGIKAVGGILKSPKKLKQILKRKTLFEVNPDFIKSSADVPPKALRERYSKAATEQIDKARQQSETWLGKDGSRVNIMQNDPNKKFYKIFNKDNTLEEGKAYSKISKRKFHDEYSLTKETKDSSGLPSSRDIDIRNIESSLGLDKGGAQLRRIKHIGKEFKDILLGVDKKVLQSIRVPLKDFSNKAANDYRNSLLKETQIKKYENDFKSKGWNTRNTFKHRILEDFFPKPLSKIFEKLLPASKRGSNDPAMRRYIYDVSRYQDANTSLLGDFMTQLYGLSENNFNIGTKELKPFMRLGMNRKDAEKLYWENMTDLKRAGKLRQWDDFTDGIFNAAREAGIEIPGYFKHYVPQMLKQEYSDIIFNDLISIKEKQSVLFKSILKDLNIKSDSKITSGIDDLLSSFNNVDELIANRKDVAKAANTLITKSLNSMSKETQNALRANIGKQGEFSALKAYAAVGRHVYNSMFSTFGNLENSRKTIIPKELLENNLPILMSQYANKAARRIAQAQTFGLKGEKFDALIKGVDARNPADANLMRELQHHVTGQIKYSSEYSYKPEVRKFVDKVLAWETGTKIGLGFATIPNLSQSMISSALDAGYWRFLRGAIALGSRKHRERIKASGATNYSQINEMMGFDERTKMTGGLINRGVDILGKYTGFNKVNELNQYLAASTASVFVKDLQKMATKKGAFSQSRKRWAISKLEKLGIDYKNKNFGDLDIANANRFEMPAIKNAMRRFASDTQLQKDILKDPIMFNNPRVLPFVQFKRFGYRQATYLKDILKHDAAHGNFLPMIRLGVAGFAGGAGVSWARNFAREFFSGKLARGESEYNPDAQVLSKLVKEGQLPGLDDFLDGLSSVGALGVLGDIITPILDEEKSMARAMEFAMTPAFLSDINNLYTQFLNPMGSDFKNFQSEAFRRVPTRLLRTGIFGGATIKSISQSEFPIIGETKGLKEQRVKSLKARELGKILRLLENGRYEKAYNNVNLWNQSYGTVFPIVASDIDARALISRRRAKIKKKV